MLGLGLGLGLGPLQMMEMQEGAGSEPTLLGRGTPRRDGHKGCQPCGAGMGFAPA